MCEDIIPCFDNNRTPSSRETVAKLQLIKGGFGCFSILHIDLFIKCGPNSELLAKNGLVWVTHGVSHYCYNLWNNPLDNKRQNELQGSKLHLDAWVILHLTLDSLLMVSLDLLNSTEGDFSILTWGKWTAHCISGTLQCPCYI